MTSNLRVIEPFRSKDGVKAEVVKYSLGGAGCVVIQADTATGDEAEVTLNATEAHDLILWLQCALSMRPDETTAVKLAGSAALQSGLVNQCPVGWLVGEWDKNPAMFNLRERDKAFDAAQRWGRPITPVVLSAMEPPERTLAAGWASLTPDQLAGAAIPENGSALINKTGE